jgi:predicted PurR-regulated permease PerM
LAPGWALAAIIMAALVLLGGCAWLFGAQVSAQADQLTQLVPEAWDRVKAYLQGSSWGRMVLEAVQGFDPAEVSGGAVRDAGSLVMSVLGGVGNLLLLVAGAIYLAAQPMLYRDGIVALVPRSAEARTRETLDAMGAALRKWLKGQLIKMVLVGALTTLGLWLIGVPSPLALGLLAGLGEFVPLIGAFATAVPALLAAYPQGVETALYTLMLYVLIQQVEGNLIMPIVERQMVSLPPVLTLFAVVAFGLVFGILGVILAAPLTVITYVAVQKLYLQSALGKGPGPSGTGDGSASR